MPEQYDDISGFPDQNDNSGFPDQGTFEGGAGDSGGGGFASGYGLPSLQDIGLTALKIPVQMGETAVGIGDILTGGFASEGLKYLGYDPGMTKKFIQSYETPELQTAREQLGKAQGYGETASRVWENPGLVGLGIEESLPYMYGGAGIGRAALRVAPQLGALGAGALGEGIISAGQQAAQIREDQGEFNLGDIPYAAGSGALTGLISAGSGRLANKLGLPDIDQFLADKTISGTRRIPALLGSAATEAGEEYLQSTQEQAASNLATDKPIGEGVAQAGLTGALAGGVTGGLVPMFRGGPEEAPSPPPRMPWVDQTQDGRPLVQGPSGPQQQELDFNAPLQGELPFGSYRGQSGRFTTEGPGYQGPYHPGLLEPIPQQFDFGEPEASQGPPPAAPPPAGGGGGVGATNNLNITGPNVIPEGSILSDNQQVVTLVQPTSVNLAYWRSQGYVPVPGLRSAQGQTQLVRGDVAPLYVTGDKRPPVAPQVPIQDPNFNQGQGNPEQAGSVPYQGRPEVPGPIAGDQAAAGDTVPVPNERINQTFIQNMADNGYKLETPGPIVSIFRKIMNSSERGALDLNGMWGVLKQMLGRDPTQQEVETAMSRQIPEGTGGAVAQFPQQSLTEQIHRLYERARRLGINPDDYRSVGELADAVNNPDARIPTRTASPPIPQNLPPPSQGQGTQIPMTQWPPGSGTVLSPVRQPRGMQPGLPGMGPLPMQPGSTAGMEVPETGGLDVGGLRQQELFPPQSDQFGSLPEDASQSPYGPEYAGQEEFPDDPNAPVMSFPNEGPRDETGLRIIMDPRMQDRVDAGGPRSFDFTQTPNQQGQMELPWSRGENPQPIDADAPARELQAAADRFRRPQGDVYQQGSMLPQFFDAEIEDALRSEDGTPPESRDLGDYGPQKEGLPSIEEMHARIRELKALATEAFNARPMRTQEWMGYRQLAEKLEQELLAHIRSIPRTPPKRPINPATKNLLNTIFGGGDDTTPRKGDTPEITAKRKELDKLLDIPEDDLTPEQTERLGALSTELGKLDHPDFQRGEAPPSLQGGMYDAARAHMREETDVNVLHEYLDMIGKAIDYHRSSGDKTEFKLYQRMRQEVVDRLNIVSAPDEPFMQREYDPSIGGDIYQKTRQTFAKTLTSSSTEDLVKIRQRMEDNLKQLKGEIYRFKDNGEQVGMAKRRVAFAETKLAALDAELQARMNPDEPAFARAPGGGYKASVDIRRAVENITRDYTSPLPGIMAREGLQNGLDASDKLGTDGITKIRLSKTRAGDELIEMYDNGKGMDDATLASKLFEAFATGKEGEEGATGGKGIGSASYIYGGQHFKVESVAIDANDVVDEEGNLIRKADGKKYRIKTNGTPEEFITGKANFSRTLVSMSEPTGTTIEVTLKGEHDIDDARTMTNNIVEHSRNRLSRIIVDETNFSKGTPLKDVQPDGNMIIESRFKSDKGDKKVGDFTTVNRNSDIKVLIPTFDASVARRSINIQYLNNGMYQFSEDLDLGAVGDNVPKDILVDIHPLVDDQNELYPFINTREDIKRDIRQEVVEYIKKNIGNPGVERRKNRTQELYDSMSPVPIQGTKRKSIIFDPGNRLTPTEMNQLVNDPTVQNLVRTYDKLVDDILAATGRKAWQDRVEGVGLVFDPGMHGVHIPNPTTKKSTILINPFLRIQDFRLSPEESSWRNVITNLHEVAHVGTESKIPFNWSPADEADPRLPKFVASLMNQIAEHGDVNVWTSTGHGMDFAHRLGEVYAKFGVDATFKAADKIHSIVTGGQKSGSYSPEIQRLLQVYQASRGRPATVEDLLSGTGVKQSNRGRTAAGSVPSNSPVAGGGTPTVEEKEYNWVKEALAVPTNATTMGDLSAPGRQGISMVLTPEFWKAGAAMFGSLHYDTFKQIDANLRAKDIMTDKIDLNTGKAIPSFGKQIGIKIFSPASEPGPRAEMTASRWLEMGIGKTTTDAQGNRTWSPTAGSKAWQNTIGVPIRATNRAFITFLNHLNVNRTEKLLNLARDMSVRGLDTGRTAMPGIMGGMHLPGGGNIGFTQKVSPTEAMDMNPYHNLVLAKEIAEFVNAATGHATAKKGIHGLSLENAVSKIGPFLFSPGLLNSRIRMMNPVTYVMASPFVRKQYLKAALSTAAAWFVSTQLLKKATGPEEAEVNDDITSADFGKVRVGDARLDLGGGFLQFAVAYGRVYAGGSTSSASGEFHRFGSGYQATSQEDTMERFFVNKLNPASKFAWDILSATEYNPMHMGDRTIQLFVPLVAQDLMEIGKENPDLLPLFGTAAMFGGGTQIYSKGESVSKFIDPENDWNVTGGGLRDLMPWNWGDEPPRNFPWSQPE